MHNFTDQIMSFDKACDLVKTAHKAGAYKAHWARISWACEKSGVAAIHTAIWSSVVVRFFDVLKPDSYSY